MKNDSKALQKRLTYVNELLAETRPCVSPSSQEWVSAEFWEGHKNILRKEKDEIEKRLSALDKNNSKVE